MSSEQTKLIQIFNSNGYSAGFVRVPATETPVTYAAPSEATETPVAKPKRKR